jgi:hypothetical protein
VKRWAFIIISVVSLVALAVGGIASFPWGGT